MWKVTHWESATNSHQCLRHTACRSQSLTRTPMRPAVVHRCTLLQPSMAARPILACTKTGSRARLRLPRLFTPSTRHSSNSLTPLHRTSTSSNTSLCHNSHSIARRRRLTPCTTGLPASTGPPVCPRDLCRRFHSRATTRTLTDRLLFLVRMTKTTTSGGTPSQGVNTLDGGRRGKIWCSTLFFTSSKASSGPAEVLSPYITKRLHSPFPFYYRVGCLQHIFSRSHSYSCTCEVDGIASGGLSTGGKVGLQFFSYLDIFLNIAYLIIISSDSFLGSVINSQQAACGQAYHATTSTNRSLCSNLSIFLQQTHTRLGERRNPSPPPPPIHHTQ